MSQAREPELGRTQAPAALVRRLSQALDLERAHARALGVAELCVVRRLSQALARAQALAVAGLVRQLSREPGPQPERQPG